MNSKADSLSKIEHDESGSKIEAYKKCAPKLLFLIEEKNQKNSDDS